MNPLITVIIACYNQAKFLPDAINSLIGQTFVNWECIIVNDGSTDNTEHIAEAFSKKDRRIRVINQTNQGPSGVRNTGLNHANGDYIQFLDADDIIASDKFILQLDALSSTKELGLCYSGYLMGLEEDINQTPSNIQRSQPSLIMEKPLHDIAARWETELSIPIHCFLFDARFFSEKNIRFDVSLPNHVDWDCWMQIFALEPTVKYVNRPLATYRINSYGICSNKVKMWEGFKKAIQKQHKIHQNNPVMNKILKEKLRQMRIVYREAFVPKPILSVLSFYEKNMPWPIQQFFVKIMKNS